MDNTGTLLYKEETGEFRSRWIHYIYQLQDTICAALSEADGDATYTSDAWERAEGKGGGGLTRTSADGNIFEKAGVNVSVVYGHLNDNMKKLMEKDGSTWFACGLSLVIHPLNPYVPTVHANWRYFELHDEKGCVSDRWFGGGTDLTPYYVFEEDAIHFHQTLKAVITPFGNDLYGKYKKNCDDYFVNKHRDGEMRGVGGVFYDQLRPENTGDAERLLDFQQANGNAFLAGYLPIVHRRKNMSFGEREIRWQEIRRGRYVEFNLIHDRGTLFGLRTAGRTESILMSLPPRARWLYNYKPEPGSEEDKLLQACLHPRDWI
jgi:coproporphyrinogen III oxidase